jgi:hypothetical protein
MARIRYGAIGTEIRGKVGGTVFQGNKHGHTIKNKGLNTNCLSPKQAIMKSNLVKCTQAWSGLTDVQRNNFISYAAAYPQYDKKTGSSKLSGYEVFLLWNLNRLSRGEAIVGTITNSAISQSVILPKVYNTGGVLYLELEAESEYGFCEYAMFLSRPVSAGKNNPGSSLRYIHTVLEDSGIVNVTTLYQNSLGTIPTVGQQILGTVRAIGILSPFLFAVQKFKFNITAL